MLRTPQRNYNPAAIERWFDRLQEPWEHVFSESELKLGRTFYRGGEVRGLELSPEMAVVSAREGKTDIYSVIEWKGDAPAVRSSIEQSTVGRALAVAGLYEIEELVLDEVPAVPANGGAPAPAAGASAIDQRGASGGGTAGGADTRGEAPGRASRDLRVRLRLSDAGIHLEADWVDASGATVPAFSRGKLTSREREDLIRLTSRALHDGFQFRKPTRDYLLRETALLAAFAREPLERWRRAFRTSIDPRILRLGKGVRDAEVIFDASEEGGRLVARWRFRLDGRLLGDSDGWNLMRARGRTLILPEQGLVRVPESAAEVLREWAPLMGEGTKAVLPPYMIFSLFGHDAVRIRESAQVKEWRRKLGSIDTASTAGLPSFLRPYQVRGAAWIANLLRLGCHVLLADEMGLGKTVQVLSALALMRGGDPDLAAAPVLIVSPASVVPVWASEIERFFPQWKFRIVGADARPQPSGVGAPAEAGAGGEIWLSSYSQLRRNRAAIASCSFGFAVLDEAQFIKNPDAKVTHACFAIPARHRIALTGTPLENRHLDLWTLFRYLMPGLLGSRARSENALRDDPQEYTALLQRQIRPFVLRRTKNEVATELPAKMEHVLVCPLTPLQRREYLRLTRKAHQDFGAARSVGDALRQRSLTFLSLLTRLRQACCDAELLPWVGRTGDPGGKIACLLTRLADILFSGRKAVIFSQFTTFLARIREHIAAAYPDVPIFELTGATADRSRPVDGFQSKSGPAIMLVSLRAGGTGITLHSAEYVFLMDPWWNPAVEAQAIDRVHRIGQDRPVSVYRLVTNGTVEERVQRLKDEKSALFDHLVGRLREGETPAEMFGSLSALIDLEERGLGEGGGDDLA